MTCKIVVVRSVWVLITLQIFPSFSFINNDGWIPLTKEEVMRKQNDRFIRRSFDEHSTSPEYNDFMATKTLKNDAIKVVVPNINFQISKDDLFNPLEATKKIKTIYQNSNKQCNNQDCELYHQENYSDEKKGELGNIEIIRRKPKSLTGADITTKDVNNELSENIILQKLQYKNPDTEFNPNKAVTERIQNIYEVTEDISDISEDTTYSKRTGYIYKHPALNAKSPTELNITNIFLDNLSKYNIRLGDDLPNYALSRQTKGSTPIFMHNLASMNIPSRFNSFNHFAVDPMLAVFLSNYGYYLPGSYGIQSKYRNIYGYLASNNIHNNKPFGSYKIYSDTDSSN